MKTLLITRLRIVNNVLFNGEEATTVTARVNQKVVLGIERWPESSSSSSSSSSRGSISSGSSSDSSSS